MWGLALIFLFNSTVHAAIYGTDDRREPHRVPAIAHLAPSVAIAVANILLVDNGDGTKRVDLVDRPSEWMCKGEPFIDQPSLGVCSGFLVGDRYLMSAGHCAFPVGNATNEVLPFCESFSWYFGYAVAPNGTTDEARVPADRLYGCKRVIRAMNIAGQSHFNPGPDYLLLELDRPVAAALKPLALASREPRVGEHVFTIGHPTGMPSKFSGYAPVVSASAELFFEAFLDTFGGNSGGPVFNSKNEVVGILAGGHPIDFSDGKDGCQKFNRCDARAIRCAKNSKYQGLPVSNYIQRVSTVEPFLPKTSSSKIQRASRREYRPSDRW